MGTTSSGSQGRARTAGPGGATGALLAVLVVGVLAACVPSGVYAEVDGSGGGRSGEFGGGAAASPDPASTGIVVTEPATDGPGPTDPAIADPASLLPAEPLPDAVVPADPTPTAADAAPADVVDEAPTSVELPDFRGKKLSDVTEALGVLGVDRVKTVDATGDGRGVWVESNWEVCTQDPRKGRQMDVDDRITLGIVKTSERCP